MPRASVTCSGSLRTNSCHVQDQRRVWLRFPEYRCLFASHGHAAAGLRKAAWFVQSIADSALFLAWLNHGIRVQAVGRPISAAMLLSRDYDAALREKLQARGLREASSASLRSNGGF